LANFLASTKEQFFYLCHFWTAFHCVSKNLMSKCG
jgi:hypothetical protein